jgi:hypothetical protein
MFAKGIKDKRYGRKGKSSIGEKGRVGPYCDLQEMIVLWKNGI